MRQRSDMHVRVGRRMALASALGMAAVALLALGGGSGGGAYGVHAQSTRAGFTFTEPPNDLSSTTTAPTLMNDVLAALRVLSSLFDGLAARRAVLRADWRHRVLQLANEHRKLCETHATVQLRTLFNNRAYALRDMHAALLRGQPAGADAATFADDDGDRTVAKVTADLGVLMRQVAVLATNVTTELDALQVAVDDAAFKQQLSTYALRAALVATVLTGGYGLYAAATVVPTTTGTAAATTGVWTSIKAWSAGLWASATAAPPSAWATAAAKGRSTLAVVRVFLKSAHFGRMVALGFGSIGAFFFANHFEAEAEILRTGQAQLTDQLTVLRNWHTAATTAHTLSTASFDTATWRRVVAAHRRGTLGSNAADLSRVDDLLKQATKLIDALAALPADVRTCTAAVDKFERDLFRP